jgi:uncharacterized membrane protein YhaH (DUF805 family)
MTIIEIIKHSNKTWHDYRGKLSRREFWISICANIIGFIIVGFVYGFFDALDIGKLEKNAVTLACAAAWLYLLIQFYSLTTRRLHDIGKSGWWILLFIFAGALSNEITKKENPSAIVWILYLAFFGSILYLFCKKGIDLKAPLSNKKNSYTLESLKNISTSQVTLYIAPALSLIIALIAIYQVINPTLRNIIIGRGALLALITFGFIGWIVKNKNQTTRLYSSIFSSIIFLLVLYISADKDINKSAEINLGFKDTIALIKNTDNDLILETDNEKPSQAGYKDADTQLIRLMNVCLKRTNKALEIYNRESKTIPIHTLFLPQTLSDDDNIQKASVFLLKYAEVFNRYIAEVESARNEYREQAINLYGANTPNMKSFDSTFLPNQILLEKYKSSVKNLLDSYADILILMGDVNKRNAVEIQDGKLMFENDKDLNRYNFLIKNGTDAEAESIKAYNAFNAKIEDFKKSIEKKFN